MNEKRLRHVIRFVDGFILCVLFAASAATLSAQSTPVEADGGQKRLKRARALVAAHKLDAAATELNSIRTTTADDSVREVARIMLMSIYLEEGEYMHAQALLEETYKLRSAKDESSTRTYFALAGQAVNGAREHFGRYRSFGINIADKELPAEAANDLDHMRMLLERVAEQAREVSSQTDKNFDGLGLLEAAASVRCTLSRTSKDRQRWQREVADVRQKLAATESRTASSGSNGPSVTLPNQPTPTVASDSSSAPNHATNTLAKRNNVTPTSYSATKAGEGKTPAAVRHTGTASSDKARELGSLIEMATERFSPSYPQIAKQARVAGVVTVYLEVDENGRVITVHRTNGPHLLKQSAEDAARRWKFKPTVIEGQAVRVLGFINFHFTL